MSELWAARDKNGSLFLYDEEPILYRNETYDYEDTSSTEPILLDSNLFPDIKFSDGPVRVKVVPAEEEE